MELPEETQDVPPAEPIVTTTTITQTIDTKNGSFDFVQSVTLGEALIALAVFLLLAFHVFKWFMESVWRGRR